MRFVKSQFYCLMVKIHSYWQRSVVCCCIYNQCINVYQLLIYIYKRTIRTQSSAYILHDSYIYEVHICGLYYDRPHVQVWLSWSE